MDSISNKPNKQNGWNEWAYKVLGDIERLSTGQDSIQKRLTDIQIELATLKGKASIWGAIAGVIFAAITNLIIGGIGK